jgi:hypothetical protein
VPKRARPTRSSPDRGSAPRPAALRPGRLRDLRHGHRDERHPARPIRAAQGEAAARNIRDLRFTRQDYYLPPEFAAPRRFYATTGISVTRDGVNHSEDVTLAARNALLNMIDHLGERGWTRQQAYAICSVAVDLKISQVVDAPNMLVSAFLPEDIFVS